MPSLSSEQTIQAVVSAFKVKLFIIECDYTSSLEDDLKRHTVEKGHSNAINVTLHPHMHYWRQFEKDPAAV